MDWFEKIDYLCDGDKYSVSILKDVEEKEIEYHTLLLQLMMQIPY